MTKSVVLADREASARVWTVRFLPYRPFSKPRRLPESGRARMGCPRYMCAGRCVHNKHVVEDLAGQGAVFVQNWRRFRMLLPKRVFRWCFPPMAYLR